MADAEMADAMALVARVAGLVVGAELEAVLMVEVVEAAARRLGCQVDAQEPAESVGMQPRFGVDRRADWWEVNRVAVVVAMELVPMAVVVAAAARPMARQEGRTVEAATVADHQAASLEAGTGAGDQVAMSEADEAVKGERMEAVEDRCTS